MSYNVCYGPEKNKCQMKRDMVINLKMQRQWIVLYSSTNSPLDDPFLSFGLESKKTLKLQSCKPGGIAFV